MFGGKSKILFVLLATCSFLLSSSLTRFGAVNITYDAIQDEDTLWIASNAGIIQFDLAHDSVIRIENSEERLPDTEISTLFLDESKTLWAGTFNGYLYSRDSRGRWEVYIDFMISESRINKIIGYDEETLLIAHDNGVSVFSIDDERVISTSGEPGITGRVFDILIKDDTLFAAVEKKITMFDSVSQQLGEFSFAFKESWDVVADYPLEVRGLTYTDSIRGFTRSALVVGNNTFSGEKSISDIRTIYNDEDDSSDVTYDTTFGELIIEEVNGVKERQILLESPVSSIRPLTSGEIVISTEADFAIIDPFNENQSIEVPGLVYGEYQNMMVSYTGDLWLVSQMTNTSKDDWWRGVTRFNGKSFELYNEETPGFGSLGGWIEFLGLAESDDGRIWFGNNGGQVKVHDPELNSWNRYLIRSDWNTAPDNHTIEYTEDAFGGGWQKVDGIIQDSSGYVWFAIWAGGVNGGGSPYRFAVLNPDNDQSAFCFSRATGEDPLSNLFHPYLGAILSDGTRLFAEPAGSEYLIVHNEYDPFTTVFDSTSFDIGQNKNGINQIVAPSVGGLALAATSEGVGLIRIDVQSLDGDTIAVDEYQGQFPYASDFNSKPVTSIAIEKCEVEYNQFLQSEIQDSVVTTTFWAAIAGVGIERLILKEYINDGESVAIMQFNNEPLIISSEGRDYFTDDAMIAIDSVNSYLWIASSGGLARYQLGYEVNGSTQSGSESQGRVYPNPYSKSRHNQLTIDNLPANVYIDIYTISGTLVSHFDTENDENFNTLHPGKSFQWSIPEGLAPGTYLIAIKDSETDFTDLKKFVIVP